MSRFAKKIFIIALFLLVMPAMGHGQDKVPHLLTVAHDANYPPFAFLDETGQPRGYLIDLWRAFGNANSIYVEFKLGSWQESLDMVRNGEADIHGGLFYSKERDLYLDYGSTIMELSTDIYIQNSLSKSAARREPTGVVKGGFEEHYMRTEHPQRLLKLFPQNKAMIEAAANGEIMVFVADQPTGFHYMNQLGINNEFSSVETLYTMPMRWAVQNGDSESLRLVNNGWANVEEAMLNHIYGKWFIPQDTTPDWALPALLLTILALVIALIIRQAGRRFAS